jgi:(p)ppGpp synthase/HD superfamily hydrolase
MPQIIPQTQTIETLVTMVAGYAPTADMDLLRLAYDFAKNAHEGQFRLSLIHI